MKVIYPGSFDPVTKGHLDIIRRCQKLFDEVVVAVLVNQQKQGLFTIQERIEMLNELLGEYENVRVDYFTGLLVDYVEQQNADAVIRGLRALSDFDYETQLALLNRALNHKVETIFLMAANEYSFISASYAKEVASWNGDVSCLVPKQVEKKLIDKYRREE